MKRQATDLLRGRKRHSLWGNASKRERQEYKSNNPKTREWPKFKDELDNLVLAEGKPKDYWERAVYTTEKAMLRKVFHGKTRAFWRLLDAEALYSSEIKKKIDAFIRKHGENELARLLDLGPLAKKQVGEINSELWKTLGRKSRHSLEGTLERLIRNIDFAEAYFHNREYAKKIDPMEPAELRREASSILKDSTLPKEISIFIELSLMGPVLGSQMEYIKLLLLLAKASKHK